MGNFEKYPYFLGIGIIVIFLVDFFSPKTRIVAAESEGQIWRKKMDLVEVIVHFNDGDGDLKTLTVWNSTECTGLTCQSTTTKAHVGDTITFRIYYHNTTNAVAENVKIKLNLPQDFSNVLLISSSVWSDNTHSPVIGTVNVNLSSQGSLRLISKSVQWHPNQSSNPMPLLYKQSGDEIVRDSGLYLGNIVGPGWDTQGYLVVSARVEEPYKE
ncbi:MAG: hypothetical protein HZB85_01800 [Deltaproteobacteria bacterium]|nr:hypothetical protein [Deltaproteobacteria bacterium]